MDVAACAVIALPSISDGPYGAWNGLRRWRAMVESGVGFRRIRAPGPSGFASAPV